MYSWHSGQGGEDYTHLHLHVSLHQGVLGEAGFLALRHDLCIEYGHSLPQLVHSDDQAVHEEVLLHLSLLHLVHLSLHFLRGATHDRDVGTDVLLGVVHVEKA